MRTEDLLLISCGQSSSTQSPNPTSCVKGIMGMAENHTRHFSSYLARMNAKRTSGRGTSFVKKKKKIVPSANANPWETGWVFPKRTVTSQQTTDRPGHPSFRSTNIHAKQRLLLPPGSCGHLLWGALCVPISSPGFPRKFSFYR